MRRFDRIVGAAWHPEVTVISNIAASHRQRRAGLAMKTVMGWIDKIVSSLARRKVNKNEGRPNTR
jgi:hypothetical protein